MEKNQQPTGPQPQSVAQVMEQALSLPIGSIAASGTEGSAADSVELTEDELNQAIGRAKWEKYERLRTEREQQDRARLKAYLTTPWTWEQMLHYIQHRAANDLRIKLDDSKEAMELYGILCRYFTNDPSFEQMGGENGWKLGKGLLLAGNVGTGKTTLMKLFARNQRMSFDIISCRTATELFERDGDLAITNFSSTRYDTARDPRNFYQQELGQCFDDFGTEKIPVVHYGNKTNVMADILLNRYDKAKGNHISTHLTTNLAKEDMEAMYGTRVTSRLREMFNLIAVDGEDRRSKL